MARIVSHLGGLGTVSGTALDLVYSRQLQQGDPGGHIRRAFAALGQRFPALAGQVGKLLSRYFVDGGIAPGRQFIPAPSGELRRATKRLSPDVSLWEPGPEFQVLNIAANFSEVWLAKEGHRGAVGINYLRKIERPLPYALLGAMLAEVDFVSVGAGSPAAIPDLIASLSRAECCQFGLKVADAAGQEFALRLDPAALIGTGRAPLKSPKLLAIVSSYALARELASTQRQRPYGFVLENSSAGGHNAPPNLKTFDANREETVVYTDKDSIDVRAISALGLPFWLAGGCSTAGDLRRALDHGAKGIQFGTTAALCLESGLAPRLRREAVSLLKAGKLKVSTEARVSPSGFPFKVAQIPQTLSDKNVFQNRVRRCDIGYLQSAYLAKDGRVAFRCPAENAAEYIRKGGKARHTEGRVCLCNGLLSAAGFPSSWPDGYVEPPIVTLGEQLDAAADLLKNLPAKEDSYHIGKVVHRMLSALRNRRA